jgi:hypothetical protein
LLELIWREDFMRKAKLTRLRLAQGMTEYIIIVGLVSMISIAAVKAFGIQLSAGLNKSRETLKNEVIKGIEEGGGGGGVGSPGALEKAKKKKKTGGS